MFASLPSDDQIIARARCGDWYGVLGISPGTVLDEKAHRRIRACVHPDRGRMHDVAAAVGQALEALSPTKSAREKLIDECSRAVQTEPLNETGAQALQEWLQRLDKTSASSASYFWKSWAKQVRQRCRDEAHEMWQSCQQRIADDPSNATHLVEEFLANVKQLAVFQEAMDPDEARCLVQDAAMWTEYVMRKNPEVTRKRRTEAQRHRRHPNGILTPDEALAVVMRHCDTVANGCDATPLKHLKTSLKLAGIDNTMLRAAGISEKTRRQHRPKVGARFYYATVERNGRRCPIKLKEDYVKDAAEE